MTTVEITEEELRRFARQPWAKMSPTERRLTAAQIVAQRGDRIAAFHLETNNPNVQVALTRSLGEYE